MQDLMISDSTQTVGSIMLQDVFSLNSFMDIQAAAIVALFESVIAKITILAVFLPVIAGQGGGMQEHNL